MSRRTERIAATLLDELARLLREEVSDPRIGLVTLTRADVAPDLSHAVIHYSVLGLGGEEDLVRIDRGLASAASFLRRRAARALPLKRMPELRFRYDPSLSLGSQTLGLLREIAEETRVGVPDAEPTDADCEGTDDEAR
jgi:ribosome-binding factor A